MAHKETFKLPPLVARPADVGRLLRELEALDEKMLQQKLRKGKAPETLPRTSALMEQTAESNGINLLHVTDRQQLRVALNAIHGQAPVFHMSFNADPPTQVIEKLTAWFRANVHPHILLNIGLQPNLGAGSVLRTTNKLFDLSLRQDFARKRDVLLRKLTEGMPSHMPAPAVAPAPVAAGVSAAAPSVAPPVRPAATVPAQPAPRPRPATRPAPQPHARAGHERSRQ